MSESLIVHGPLSAICDVINRSLATADCGIYPSPEFRRVGMRAVEMKTGIALVVDIVAPWLAGEAVTILADHESAEIEAVATGEYRWALKLVRCDAEVASIALQVMDILRQRYDVLNPGSVPFVAASPAEAVPTAGKLPRVPSRRLDFNRWCRCWQKIESEDRKGKKVKDISEWLAKLHPDFYFAPDTLRDIIVAGRAGLLDRAM